MTKQTLHGNADFVSSMWVDLLIFIELQVRFVFVFGELDEQEKSTGGVVGLGIYFGWLVEGLFV